ncbi:MULTISPECIES: DnaJ domain-containing protein [unclassified Microbacterium]|uniref:J domain-containing protein n=1 Tax=unclassified Microbacterium TaxID=2609290 RepID=UPI00214CD935|nr:MULTISPECIES: DnaJ domain-containing protein [unclassified Microbacterium]MCR2783342.1 DnaJ domain-containing protein [Microbacterium sp. zg.B96]MDL5351875.1 DnaJ domain-containing protein [Microbacterium sp. zg-YB36]WIM15785.1 DnaJ domain-containing protein [Microbacterium sp. zg-B96]
MFDSPLSASAYDVLAVDPSADEDALRKAYRLRLRQTHPDTGGDAAVFVQVQRAWELVGTPEARAAYDRGHGFADTPAPDYSGWKAPAARPDTRPRARSFGHPGGWRRERYLSLIREWAGRGVDLPDPYDPALVRTAPHEVRRLLADALAEEATARVVADLGMGYTVWHDVSAPARGDRPDAKLDHIVLGPSGLYAVLSEDFGGPVRVRRGELIGDGVEGAPIADLVARARTIARAAGVRFSGAVVVLPDDDLFQPVEELGKVRGLPVAVVSRSTLATVLRRGMTGARDIGGNELFDVRARLQRTVRFV